MKTKNHLGRGTKFWFSAERFATVLFCGKMYTKRNNTFITVMNGLFLNGSSWMNMQSLSEQVRLMQDRFQVVGRRFSLILQVTEEPDERYAIAEMMTWVVLSMETLATIQSTLKQEPIDQDLTAYQKSVGSLNDDLTIVEKRQKEQIEAFVDEKFVQ